MASSFCPVLSKQHSKSSYSLHALRLFDKRHNYLTTSVHTSTPFVHFSLANLLATRITTGELQGDSTKYCNCNLVTSQAHPQDCNPPLIAPDNIDSWLRILLKSILLIQRHHPSLSHLEINYLLCIFLGKPIVIFHYQTNS